MVSKLLRSVTQEIIFLDFLNRPSYGVDNNSQGHLKFKINAVWTAVYRNISPIPIKQITFNIVIVQHN